MATRTVSRHTPWTGGCEADPLSQPIRKSYPWRGQMFASSWSPSQALSNDFTPRCEPIASIETDIEGKVLGGCGVPRTASLPQLAPPSSSNASPEDRARTSLANSASAPAVPPAGLADSQPAGGAVLSAPLEQSSYSARPSSAPPSSYGQPDGRSFRSATDPFPSPTEWPAAALLEASGPLGSSAPPPATAPAQALGIPHMRPVQRHSGNTSGDGSYRLQRALGGSGEAGGKGHGSCCALDALCASGSTDSVTNSKQHGSYSALSMLASQGSNESSPALPPLAAAGSSGNGSTFFGRGFLQRGRSADLGTIGAGRGRRLGLGSGKQRKEQADEPPSGSPGADAMLSGNDPSDGGRRLPVGSSDEQLMPLAGAANDRFGPFGSSSGNPAATPGAAPSAQPPALRIAVRRPRSPGPPQFFAADAPAAAGSLGGAFSAPDNRLSPAHLPLTSGVTPLRAGSGMSQEALAELPPLERHQHGSCAALAALAEAPPSSPSAAAGGSRSRPQSPSPLSLHCPVQQQQRQPSPEPQSPQQQPPRDNEQPRVLRSPKRGYSGRLSGSFGHLRVSTSPEQTSSAFGLLSAAASQLQGESGGRRDFASKSAGSSSSPPSAQGGLRLSSTESLATRELHYSAPGSGSTSCSGSADWTSRFGSLSADSLRMLPIMRDTERTMKAGQRRGSGPLLGNTAFGLLPTSPPSPASLGAALQELLRMVPDERQHGSPQGKASSPPQQVLLPSPYAEAAAAHRASHPVAHPIPSPKPFGSLVSEAPLDRNSQEAPLQQNEQLPNRLCTRSAGGRNQMMSEAQQQLEDYSVQSSFGSIFLPADSKTAVAETAAAVAAAAHPAAAPASPHRPPMLHRHSSGSHHSHSAPSITAVKVVPRVGDANDTGPLRTRFTSLPIHLDAITEK